VLVSMGTVFHRTPGLHETILAALRDEPVNLLIAPGSGQDPARLGPLPPPHPVQAACARVGGRTRPVRRGLFCYSRLGRLASNTERKRLYINVYWISRHRHRQRQRQEEDGVT